MIKCFIRGNYLILVDTLTTPSIEFEGLRKDVRVRRMFIDSDTFYFDNINEWSQSRGVNISQLVDENEIPYTLESFISFYSSNTGNFNQGGGNSTQLTIVENVATLPVTDINTSTIYVLPDGSWNIYNGLFWESIQNKTTTTSILPKYHDGAVEFSAVANDITKVAEFVELSDGSKVGSELVEMVGHGFEVGTTYYVSQDAVGEVTNLMPENGIVQGIFYVLSDDVISINVENPIVVKSEEKLIFRHDITKGGLFTNTPTTKNINKYSIDPINESKFSILEHLEDYRSLDGRFRFRVFYPELNEWIIWEQTNNAILDKTLGQNINQTRGLKILSSSSVNILGDTVGSRFIGLNNSNSLGAYFDLSESNNYHYPIGQRTYFDTNKMPVTIFGGVNITTVGAVELYVTKIEESRETVSDDPNNVLKIGYDNSPLLKEDDIAPEINASKEEIWLKIGQSNAVGTDDDNPIIHHYFEDAIDPRVFEFSQGIDKSGFYFAAPYGELMAYRNPAQDDSSGIGFGQWFGKQRVRLNPSIKKLIVINRAVGATGFSDNRWNEGDDLFNLALNDLLLAMANNPEAVFKGILWQQGPRDISYTQLQYEDSLRLMVGGFRGKARELYPDRVDAKFICGTMIESWVKANEPLRRHIDLAHRNVKNYINSSGFADFKDLIENNDSIHFGNNDLREMGRRYANVAQRIEVLKFPSYWLKVVNGKLVDLLEGGAKVFNLTTAVDGTRGDVIDSQNIGFRTSMILNNKEYTKSGWLYIKSAPVSGGGDFISGITSTVATRHIFGWRSSGNGSTPTTANVVGFKDYVTLNTWVHVALTYNGSELKLYIDSVLTSTLVMGGGANMLAPLNIDLLSYNTPNNPLNALADDVVIYPYALSDAGVVNLYQETLI